MKKQKTKPQSGKPTGSWVFGCLPEKSKMITLLSNSAYVGPKSSSSFSPLISAPTASTSLPPSCLCTSASRIPPLLRQPWLLFLEMGLASCLAKRPRAGTAGPKGQSQRPWSLWVLRFKEGSGSCSTLAGNSARWWQPNPLSSRGLLSITETELLLMEWNYHGGLTHIETQCKWKKRERERYDYYCGKKGRQGLSKRNQYLWNMRLATCFICIITFKPYNNPENRLLQFL